MYNKVDDTYPPTVQVFSDQYRTKTICDKAVDTCHFLFDYVSNWSNAQEICDNIVSKESFILNYYLDRYKTQEWCDKTDDACI